MTGKSLTGIGEYGDNQNSLFGEMNRRALTFYGTDGGVSCKRRTTASAFQDGSGIQGGEAVWKQSGFG